MGENEDQNKDFAIKLQKDPFSKLFPGRESELGKRSVVRDVRWWDKENILPIKWK